MRNLHPTYVGSESTASGRKGMTQAPGGGSSWIHSGGFQFQEEDELDAFTELRPESRSINNFVVVRSSCFKVSRSLGYLALLWSTVVLLGGFVSVLTTTDFVSITIISILQAAGLINLIGDDTFASFMERALSPFHKLFSPVQNHRPVVKTPPPSCEESTGARGSSPALPSSGACILLWLTKAIHKICCAILIIPVVFAESAVYLLPMICCFWSLRRLDSTPLAYGIDEGDDSKANLKPALDLFYSLISVHYVLQTLLLELEMYWGILLNIVSLKYGLDTRVVAAYFFETKRRYENDPACINSWNFITFGAGLLDSVSPDDYVCGARVLNMLIDQGLSIRRLLILSPRQTIEKLIRTLRSVSPLERETRAHSARIVAHLSTDLKLAEFPRALECISTLFDTSGHKNGDQEAMYYSLTGNKLPMIITKTITITVVFTKYIAIICRKLQDLFRKKKQEQQVISEAAKGTNEDLILQGLRILENLAHDQDNCAEIYRYTDLLLKIVAPMSSSSLMEDIEINAGWKKVVDGSLRVVSRLMGAPGDTGKNMRRQIADDTSAVANLEAVLCLEINSGSLALQTRATDVLAQLVLDESTCLYRNGWENLVLKKAKEALNIRALNIFLANKWMEDYLAERRKTIDEESAGQNWHHRMAWAKEKKKAADGTARRLKEKAGDALVMLSMQSHSNSEAIRSFTGCGGAVVHLLTEMLDSNSQVMMTTKCRTSAAAILKHLCTHCAFPAPAGTAPPPAVPAPVAPAPAPAQPAATTPPPAVPAGTVASTVLALDVAYLKETTLKKVLGELLHIKPEPGTLVRRNGDIENQICCGGGGSKREPSSDPNTHINQQSEERRLQAALLSLCAEIRSRMTNDARAFADLAVRLVSPEDLAGKLKKVVEENSHATPASMAILKLTCEMVKALIPHDRYVEEVRKKKEVVEALSQASGTMAGVESCLLFAGADHDCYGIAVKPLYSALVKEAEELLRQKENEFANNVPAAAAGP